jgi:hypothetical protein
VGSRMPADGATRVKSATARREHQPPKRPPQLIHILVSEYSASMQTSLSTPEYNAQHGNYTKLHSSNYKCTAACTETTDNKVKTSAHV